MAELTNMDKDTFILLVDDTATGIDSIRRVLADRANRFRVQRVEDLPTALARILGGGVDIVLLNLASAAGSEAQRLLPFLELRNRAPHVPVVVLCGSADESLAESAIREGAADYLIREACDVDLLRVLRTVVAKTGARTAPSQKAAAGNPGRVLAFMGSKGGAGTTTVALNVAAALAKHHTVILAELHSELGTLAHYFEPHRSVRDIGDLLNAREFIPGEAETCLWPCKTVPGLRVLFASRNLESSHPLAPANARALLADLAGLAEYVVLDLPVSLAPLNRAVVEDSALFAMVVERDPIAVESARLILRAMDAWNASRVLMGVVLLNRSALVSPMPLAEIEARLPAAILGVVPPAADICSVAQHSHNPLVTFDSESMPAVALQALSQAISQQIPSTSRTASSSVPLASLPVPRRDLERVPVR